MVRSQIIPFILLIVGISLLLFGFVVGHMSIVEEDGLESPGWAKSDNEVVPISTLLLFSGGALVLFGIAVSVILYKMDNIQNS
jgi:hypothetical protein